MTHCRLAVVVLTYNEEINLPRCLDSLAGLDCTVVVVDSGSIDKTLEIAQRYQAVCLSHPFENYAVQRNWAQESPRRCRMGSPSGCRRAPHARARRRIGRTLPSPSPDIDGYLLRKRTIFMGRWIRHGGRYPRTTCASFRRYKGRCEDRLYDQHFVVAGKVKPLDSDYLDIVATNLSTWTLRHKRWAELEATEMLAHEQAERRRQSAPTYSAIPSNAAAGSATPIRAAPYSAALLCIGRTAICCGSASSMARKASSFIFCKASGFAS